jgi:hypothetical protein
VPARAGERSGPVAEPTTRASVVDANAFSLDGLFGAASVFAVAGSAPELL